MTRKHSNMILIGIVVGIVFAFICLSIFGEGMINVKVLGDLFLTSLRMIVVPLVITSVTVGIMRMGDVRKIGSVGGKTLLYYVTTTAFSVGLGILLVNVMQPGVGVDPAQTQFTEDEQSMVDAKLESAESKLDLSWEDIILSFVHKNIIGAAAEGKMLPLILFSIIFAGIVTTMGARGQPLIDFFESANEAIMKFVHLIMFLAPIGIFGLVAAKFAAFGDSAVWAQKLAEIGKYMGTVILGLSIHGVVTLPLLCYFFARRNPLRLFISMLPAWLTALSTASSSATLPLTIDCAENRAKISPRAAGFVLPLGATINMDGTALYEAVAAIFIAQAYGIHLGPEQMFLVFITATIVSVGAAGIPEAGLFMMVIVLDAVGLPIEGIALIVVVDWLLDRFRTSINVWGDSVGAAIIDKTLKGSSNEQPETT